VLKTVAFTGTPTSFPTVSRASLRLAASRLPGPLAFLGYSEAQRRAMPLPRLLGGWARMRVLSGEGCDNVVILCSSHESRALAQGHQTFRQRF